MSQHRALRTSPLDWRVIEGDEGLTVLDVRYGRYTGRDFAERVCESYNACAGISDPERAVPMLVEALREALAIAEDRQPGSYDDIMRVCRAALAAAGVGK